MERQLFEHIRSRLFGETKLNTSQLKREPMEKQNVKGDSA